VRIDRRLEALGIELPAPAAPAASYLPFVVTQGWVHVSGQLPMEDGRLAFRGRVGRDLTLDEAREAARRVGIGVLAQLREACAGDLDRVERCVQLQGFVHCTDDFDQQPAVIDAASALMVEVFGDAGRHARFAVGCNALPFGAAVEIAAVFALRG